MESESWARIEGHLGQAAKHTRLLCSCASEQGLEGLVADAEQILVELGRLYSDVSRRRPALRTVPGQMRFGDDYSVSR